MRARGGPSGVALRAAGCGCTTASSTAGTPSPVLAEICRISSRRQPMTETISSARFSGSAPGRSILFSTGMISRSFSRARRVLARVCASTPWVASTTRMAPSQAARLRDTS